MLAAMAIEAALRRETVLWGAPTFKQGLVGWEEVYRAAGGCARFVTGRMTVYFPKLGRIIFRSLDNPDNARGLTVHGMVIDEAPLIQEDAWASVLRPMISDTGGWAILVGTPKGRNWFWNEFIAAKDASDAMAWQIPTLGVKIAPDGLERAPHPLENPDFPFDEAVRLWVTMPERVFRQEFMAEFIEDAGAIFRGVNEAATAQEQLEPIEGHTYVMGVDWGKYEDFTVIVVLDATTASMAAMDRFNRIDYTVQMGRLQAMVEKFHPTSIWVERNAMGDPLVEELERKGLPIRPFTTTSASKSSMIDALTLAIERGALKILPDPVLIEELQAYEIKRTRFGTLQYSAPAGFHDDCVIALGLAWLASPYGEHLSVRIVEHWTKQRAPQPPW